MIYGAILIPVITALVLLLLFKRKTLWWEFSIPIGGSVLLILLAKVIIETSMLECKEYWGSFISKAEYYEEWDEWITQTCTRQYACGTDSKGNTEYCTEIYDCSYRRYHSPYWQITTTTNETVGISQTEYNRLAKFYGNQKFIELNRDYYRMDGDKYSCNWMKDSIKAVPVSTVHYYENKVKVANQSVFHFQDVDTTAIKFYNLKEYPAIYDNYKQNALIGDYGTEAQIANKKLQYINGLLGHKKQVKVFVLVFQNQPMEAAFYQEGYWSGGNMNEFIVCIGIDNARKVQWCHPISWTTNEELKVRVRQFVTDQNKLNLPAVADFMQGQIANGFNRRDFKEFDYLTVEPPTWAIVLTYILTLLLNLGLSFWIITNEHEETETDEYDVRLRNRYNNASSESNFKKRWRYFTQWLKKQIIISK